MCECGCGRPTSIATQGNTKLGHVAGRPLRFYTGHYLRPPPGYQALHVRVRKAWGYSGVCERCGPVRSGRTEWANLSHDYNFPLVREEWAEVCRSCHYLIDGKVTA